MRKLEAMLLARAFKAKAEYWKSVADKLHQGLPDEERTDSWTLALDGERAVELMILGANAGLVDSALDSGE